MSPLTKQDLTVGVVIYTVLIWFFVQTQSMLSDSSLFPRLIIGIFAILNTFMIIRAFKEKGSAKLSIQELKMPLLIFLGIVVYVIMFRFIGYFISTAIMMLGMMILFKVKPFYKIVAVILGYCMFVYVLFVMQLNVIL
ncbi:Tripartite tricarboxylate transporter TctB family protein [Anaerovirgula multivorans]|uniref:Tripartite tricarboxylate transporter TctB family protein n=1 Tax=Anaerovirgula multivorans TaxID=312168 RepID=A0A239L4T4_9FIRM|nr:tripartite tricarboxylate transporter TctB family protein [Anaerovirgula multivorans]SNT25320.1 Tripartite tricarboxylate transporter TctB family protein [Anaerovirgula multivorans]